jgi:hypothetical protein
MKLSLRIAVICFAVELVPGAMQGTTINLADDFVNSVFSYGYETTLGGTFTPFGVVDISSRPGITALLRSGTFPGSPPYVAHNATGSPYNLGFLTLPPDTLDLHPGANGEFTVVRFEPSVTSSYTISGLFSGLDSATTDVHVLLDGVSIFDGNINGLGNTSSFNLVRTLSSSDTLDFLVGFGSDRDFASDSTGLSGSISTQIPVPEPGSIGLVGVGLLAMAMLGRVPGSASRIRRSLLATGPLFSRLLWDCRWNR